MTGEDLEELLRAWGRWYGERPALEVGGGGGFGSAHPLARALAFAPGKRAVDQRTAIERGGQARRRLMAEAAGGKQVGMRILPAAFVDPVPCRETRPAVFGSGERSRPAPVPVQLVQRASLDLHRVDELAGLCLRFEYCSRGSQAEKAARVSERMRTRVGLRMYREALARGKGWVQCSLVRVA